MTAVPLPRRLAVLNKHFANRLTRIFAGRAPGFAIVHHVGRKTGREYRTPVNIFHNDGRYLIALTYGGGSWVENVLDAGSCSIETRGHVLHLVNPERYADPSREGVPTVVRWILGVIDVDEFLSLDQRDRT